MLKTCSHCRLELPLTSFHRNKNMTDGRQPNCKECRKGSVSARQFLGMKHTFMRQRIVGSNSNAKRKNNTWLGKDIMDRHDFIAWALESTDFWRLYISWVDNDCPRAMCPSIDRITNERGYTPDNMMWTTVSDNSIRRNKRMAA